MPLPPLTPNAWLRFDLIRGYLDRIGRERRGRLGDILEVGVGQGAVGSRLALRGEYLGIDLDAASVAVAQRRLAALGAGEARLGGLADVVEADRSFDVLCAFEVLEHIEDDAGALRAWHARLRPGGFLILSVPAFAHRYGPTDRMAGHFRRYDPSTMATRLSQAGFEVLDVRCYGAGLGHLLEAVRNRLARRRGIPAGDVGSSRDELLAATSGSGRLFQPPAALAPLTQLGTWPFRLAQRPFRDRGTGLIALGRRRGDAA